MAEQKAILENIKKELIAVYNREIDGEDYNFYDYIADKVNSVLYITNEDKIFVAVKLFLYASDGGFISIDTDTCELARFWNNGHIPYDCERLQIPSEVCDELEEIYYEFYNEL